jgi:hypothetical protein
LEETEQGYEEEGKLEPLYEILKAPSTKKLLSYVSEYAYIVNKNILNRK